MSETKSKVEPTPLAGRRAGAPRVLLVDDQPENLSSFEAALAGVDATTVRAQSGEEALGLLLQGEFAAILLDVRMPGIDGFETARLIRARAATRHVPIILITAADPTPPDVARAYALGAVDLLSKPLHPEALRAKVGVLVELFQRGREVRESRALYDTLSTLAPVGVFHTNPEGDCLWVNPRWCEIAGMTAEAACGKGWSRAIHPEDRERVFAEWYDAAAHHRPFRSEYRFLRPDGIVTWVVGQAKAELDDSGKAIGYVGTVTDITDRKKIEEELRKARGVLETRVEDRTRELHEATERVRLVLEAALDAVVTIDETGSVVDWNPQAERIFGWSRGEVLGRTMSELIIPSEYRERHQKGMENYLRGGKGPILGKRLELPALRKDGCQIPVELTVIPVRVGGRAFFSAFLRDLSEQRKAEEGLALLASVVRSSEDAIYTVTLDGTLTSWNEGAERMYGYRAEEMVGRPITLLLPEEIREEEARILERIARGERLRHYETIRNRKDNSVIEVSLTVSPVLDWHGKVVGASKTARDITDLKQAERQIRELNRDLEKRVQERTAQLQDTMANLEAFSYSVAHDLKAPVRSMKSYSQLLLEEYGEKLDQMARNYAERIAKSSDQMDTLIRDLLAYSRMSQEELQPQRVDLGGTWRGVLEEYSGEIADRRASVSLEGDFPPVLGHAVTLGQVFANLLTNAIKFVEPGVEAKIRIRAEHRNSCIRVWVEDNGIGIEPRHRDRLFRVFERLHDHRSYPGTGIGLAIVKKAMERMGGTCGVESEPGKGSRFWVELPAA